jgi:hypothetical protein
LASIRIPREPDLVLVSWTRNPLMPGSLRRVSAFRAIGSARPCVRFLRKGASLSAAVNCLKRNGFRVVCNKKTTDVSGFLVLQR